MKRVSAKTVTSYQIGEAFITHCSAYYWGVYCGNPGKARAILFFRNIQTELDRSQLAELIRTERKRK